MIYKTLTLTALSALVLFGVHADEQVTEEQTTILADVQNPSEEAILVDGDENTTEELIARCPCRDRKNKEPSAEEPVLVCEDGDEDDNTLAHHGDEGDHDLACDDSENNEIVG